jgi:quinol monooxygenase YgiN
MILIKIIMNVLPVKQKEVLQTLLSLIEPPGEKSGCLSCDIFCDIKDEHVFNLISEWDTRRHLNGYLSSDRFSVLLGIRSLLYEPMEILIFTVSAAEGNEAVDSARKQMKQLLPITPEK